MRNSPKPSRPMSGRRSGATPSSPSYLGTAMKSAGSSRTAFSGVTTTHFNDLSAIARAPLSRSFGVHNRRDLEFVDLDGIVFQPQAKLDRVSRTDLDRVAGLDSDGNDD